MNSSKVRKHHTHTQTPAYWSSAFQFTIILIPIFRTAACCSSSPHRSHPWAERRSASNYMMQQFFAFIPRSHKNQTKRSAFFHRKSHKIRFFMNFNASSTNPHPNAHEQICANIRTKNSIHSLPANSCYKLPSWIRWIAKKSTVNIEKKEMIPPKELHTAFCCQQTLAKYDLITESNHTWGMTDQHRNIYHGSFLQ